MLLSWGLLFLKTPLLILTKYAPIIFNLFCNTLTIMFSFLSFSILFVSICILFRIGEFIGIFKFLFPLLGSDNGSSSSSSGLFIGLY